MQLHGGKCLTPLLKLPEAGKVEMRFAFQLYNTILF